MARKVRSDIRVGNLEKKLGLAPGAIRNPDGTDARSNKKLSTLRKEFSQAKTNKVKTNPTISAKSLASAARAVNSVLSGNTSSRKPAVSKTVKPKPKPKPIKGTSKSATKKTK